ncbi:endoglucanase c [Pyrenophora seminiperda CCB06]|uniref:Endoglucanase c n=1 Tax=Pyrenophora seminiperda CCB06 TaxID=1302712 RepID=A0A3M7M4A4_9PLEO|nr:endoglucanase c [Pyrenophora seminiperda CCB06]
MCYNMFAKSLAVLSIAAIAHGRVVVVNERQAAAPAIVFDGRVKSTATQADFDTATGPFGKDFVKGQNLTFSTLVAFPNVPASLFDTAVGAKPIEVQINDKSIFVPGDVAANAQTAVRRTELNPNGGGNTTVGIKTLHVSLQPSAAHPLNISHEYLLTFLERSDFGANLFQLRTGTLLGSDGSSKNDLVLQGNTAAGTKTLFTTPFTAGVFTNLALQMDFTANTIQVFQSSGTAPLAKATEPLPNDLSGNGQFHFGANKNPVNPGADVKTTGFQESGILEGVVYGGIFIEDTASGSVTLS